MWNSQGDVNKKNRGGNASPLKNGLVRHRDAPPNFAGSKRTKKFVRLAEASLANRQLKKPGMSFFTDF